MTYIYGAITLYGPAFQPASTSTLVSYFLHARQHAMSSPTTPHLQPLPGITQAWFSLIRFRSPLLSESLLFSLPVGTEMFHFPTFPPHALYIQARVTRHDSCWVSPFGHPRITARLPTPQGLSQAPTSFIGSRCQGIHHVPFTACLNNVTTTHPRHRRTNSPTTPTTHMPSTPPNTNTMNNTPAHPHNHRNEPATTTHINNPQPSAPPIHRTEDHDKSRAAEDARVHYADLKQQPHQHPPDTQHARPQAKGGPEAPPVQQYG